MEVLCVGMYRSCSTWQYNICAELVERKGGGRRLGFLDGCDYQPPDEPESPSWRVLKTHDGHESFTAALRDGRACAVYARRDLRDVVFSLMHKFSMDFEEVVSPGGLLSACMAVDQFWPGQPNVLCQTYEQIVADPARAVIEIADHLGFDLADREARELASEFSAGRMRDRANVHAEELRSGGVDLSNPRNALKFHSRTLLHWNHIRAGAVGGWRNLASPRQQAILARLCGPWLRSHGYEDRAEAPARPARAS